MRFAVYISAILLPSVSVTHANGFGGAAHHVTLGAQREDVQSAAVVRELAIAQQAFTELSRGNADAVVSLLSASVIWRATAVREFSDGVPLDRRGAAIYLRRMARSIALGKHQLRILSIETEQDVIRIHSAWVGRENRECINLVRFEGGKVVSVIEHSG